MIQSTVATAQIFFGKKYYRRKPICLFTDTVIALSCSRPTMYVKYTHSVPSGSQGASHTFYTYDLVRCDWMGLAIRLPFLQLRSYPICLERRNWIGRCDFIGDWGLVEATFFLSHYGTARYCRHTSLQLRPNLSFSLSPNLLMRTG
jgi:hypothetical protein